MRTDPRTAPQGYYPIHREDIGPTELRLAHIIGGETLAAVDGFHGGVAIVFDQLRPPQTEAELIERLHSARLLPEFEQFAYRQFKIVGLETASEDSGLPAEQRRLSSIALLVTDENLVYEDDPVLWETDLASKELSHAKAALSSQKTLQKVNQFAPQIAAQMTQQAIMAILLAMVAIVIYVWIRFGSMHFGLAAIVALVHDVTFSLGCVAISFYIFRAFGDNVLLIRDFKIDLPMVAALLTIVGYSLNDTIVVFDRIRENRGKLKEVTPQIVNASINQTLSRTVLTSLTTMLAVLVMYIWGGERNSWLQLRDDHRRVGGYLQLDGHRHAAVAAPQSTQVDHHRVHRGGAHWPSWVHAGASASNHSVDSGGTVRAGGALVRTQA